MSDTLFIAGASRTVVYVDATGRIPGTHPSYTFSGGTGSAASWNGTYEYVGEASSSDDYEPWTMEYWAISGESKYLTFNGGYCYLFSSLSYPPWWYEYTYRKSGDVTGTATWSAYYEEGPEFTVVSSDASSDDSLDGSTPALALDDLPAALADNTVYLIRRSNGYCNLASQSYSGSAICLIGMPKSTDPDYGAMPEAARTAWGSDTGDYAMVQTSGAQGVNATALDWLVLSRIYLMRTVDPSAGDHYCFYMSSTSVYANVEAHRCRFGVYGYDFESSAYTGTPQRKANCYIGIARTRVFRLSDSVVIWTPGSPSSGQGPTQYVGAFTFHTGNNPWSEVSISNVTAWGSFTPDANDSRRTTPNLFYSYQANSGGFDTLIARDIAVHFIHMGTSTRVPGVLWIWPQISFMDIRNISIDVVSRSNGIDLDEVTCTFPDYYTSYDHWGMVYFRSVAEYNVEGLDVALPRIRCGYNDIGVFALVEGGTNNPPGYARCIQDVNITLCGLNETPLDTGSGSVYSRLGSTESSSSYANLKGAAFLVSRTTRSIANGVLADLGHPPVLTDIHVSNPKGIAMSLNNAYINDCEMAGGVYLYNSVADIDYITCDFPGRAINLKTYSQARVGTITLDKTEAKCTEYGGNAGDYASVGDPYNSMTLVVGSSDGDLCSLSGNSSSGDDANLFCCNSARATGRYTCRTRCMTAEAWSVYRTNGAAASLKITGTASGTIRWGYASFKGFQATPASTGNKTVSLYIAHKGMSGTPNGNVHVTLLVPGANGTTSIINADSIGWQEDSASTWNGEQGLTCYKLSVPVVIGAVAPVEAKMCWSWYTASAYAYLDPKIEIV